MVRRQTDRTLGHDHFSTRWLKAFHQVITKLITAKQNIAPILRET